MNIRLQKYKANRLKGMNIYNAARAAGYSEAYSRKAMPERVAKVSMADAFEQAGLTDKAIVQHSLEGLMANKVISANITYGEADGKTTDFIDVPDWASRHKYLETILKMTDRLKDTVRETVRDMQIIIVRDSGDKVKTISRQIPIQQ